MGHNGPPIEAAAATADEIVVTASITGTLVQVGGFFGSVIIPGPFASAGEPSDVATNMFRMRPTHTSTVDRSDDFRRIRAAQDARDQAERSEGNPGWFGLVFNFFKALTGN
jgi:hypothetical protein